MNDWKLKPDSPGWWWCANTWGRPTPKIVRVHQSKRKRENDFEYYITGDVFFLTDEELNGPWLKIEPPKFPTIQEVRASILTHESSLGGPEAYPTPDRQS